MLVALALAVNVRTLEGAFEDELVSLGAGMAMFADREVPMGELLSLDWPERGGAPGGPHAVLLEGGYVLRCEVAGLAGERLLTRGRFSVPLEFVSAVVFSGERPRVARSIMDLLLLASGDELKGALADVEERGLVFESRLGRREYRFRELLALVTSSRLSRPPECAMTVELADGSVLPFESLEIGEEARGVALGIMVSLPRRSLARVRFRPGGAVELPRGAEARYEPTW